MRINVLKVPLLIISLLFFNVACSSSGKKLVRSLDSPDQDEAVIVGRFVTTPAIDYAGHVFPDPEEIDDPLHGRATFTFCPTEDRPAENVWDTECDFQTALLSVRQFFAVKVSPTKNFAWQSVATVLENKA